MSASDAVYEACPHCEGTGRRVVPPPPRRRGGQQPGKGRTHGYEGTYQSGCRCILCRAAHREGQRRRDFAVKVPPTDGSAA